MNTDHYDVFLVPVALAVVNLCFAGLLHRSIVFHTELIQRRFFFEALALMGFLTAIALSITGLLAWRDNPQFVLLCSALWIGFCLTILLFSWLRYRHHHQPARELDIPDLWLRQPMPDWQNAKDSSAFWEGSFDEPASRPRADASLKDQSADESTGAPPGQPHDEPLDGPMHESVPEPVTPGSLRHKRRLTPLDARHRRASQRRFQMNRSAYRDAVSPTTTPTERVATQSEDEAVSC